MSRKSIRATGSTTCQTAYGWAGIAWSSQGLVAITLPEPSEAEALGWLPESSGPEPELPEGLDLPALLDKLRGYFEGQPVTFDEPLDPTLG
nr:hypothetical protein [Anaerolineae bacterium]